jgi:hypothetical protein
MNSIDKYMAESDLESMLKASYRECWWRLLDALSSLTLEEMRHLSNPFLIKCLPAYRKSPIKVLFVGQETSGWESFETTLSKFNNQNRDAMRDEIIEFLQWMYEDFRFNRKWGNTLFWRGVRRLYQAVSPNKGDDGFLHTELVRFDLNSSRPPHHVEELLQREYNVLPMEIEALSPNIIMFLTGPNYDERIIKTFHNFGGSGRSLTFEPVEEMKHNALVRLSHSSLPYHSYRTYHPGFSLLHDESVFTPIENKIKELLRTTPIK